MGFTDLFNGSALICILLTLFIAGLLYLYLSYKIAEQDHKFSSMLGLVSTFADELNLLKNKVAILTANMNGGSSVTGDKKNIILTPSSLIQVSDNEVDTDEDMDEEIDDEEEDDEDDEENEDEEQDIEDIIDISDNKNITIFNINGEDEILSIGGIEEIKSENESDEEDFDENDQSVSSYDEIHSGEASVATKAPTQVKTITLDLEESDPDHLFDNIEVHLKDHTPKETKDIKKLPIGELRTMLTEKGYDGDVSKLKKNELLKILSNE